MIRKRITAIFLAITLLFTMTTFLTAFAEDSTCEVCGEEDCICPVVCEVCGEEDCICPVICEVCGEVDCVCYYIAPEIEDDYNEYLTEKNTLEGLKDAFEEVEEKMLAADEELRKKTEEYNNLITEIKSAEQKYLEAAEAYTKGSSDITYEQLQELYNAYAGDNVKKAVEDAEKNALDAKDDVDSLYGEYAEKAKEINDQVEKVDGLVTSLINDLSAANDELKALYNTKMDEYLTDKDQYDTDKEQYDIDKPLYDEALSDYLKYVAETLYEYNLELQAAARANLEYLAWRKDNPNYAAEKEVYDEFMSQFVDEDGIFDEEAFEQYKQKYEDDMRAYEEFMSQFVDEDGIFDQEAYDAYMQEYEDYQDTYNKWVDDKKAYDKLDELYLSDSTTTDDGTLNIPSVRGFAYLDGYPNPDVIAPYKIDNGETYKDDDENPAITISVEDGVAFSGATIVVSGNMTGYVVLTIHVGTVNKVVYTYVIDLSKAATYTVKSGVNVDYIGYGEISKYPGSAPEIREVVNAPTGTIVENPGEAKYPVCIDPLVLDKFNEDRPMRPKMPTPPEGFLAELVSIEGINVIVWRTFSGEFFWIDIVDQLTTQEIEEIIDILIEDGGEEVLDIVDELVAILPPVVVTTAVPIGEVVTVDEPTTPLTETPLVETPADEEEEEDEIVETPAVIDIEDPDIPLIEIGETSSWSLWNLILSIATIVLALAMGIRAIAGNKKKDEYEENAKSSQDSGKDARKKNIVLSLLVPVAAIAACVMFVLTQDMSAPMAQVDSWTAAHAGIFAAGLISFIFADRKVKDEAKEEVRA